MIILNIDNLSRSITFISRALPKRISNSLFQGLHRWNRQANSLNLIAVLIQVTKLQHGKAFLKPNEECENRVECGL